MNTKMNQRCLATIERIESAFLSQIQTKSVREITVTDICTQEEINRSTFYENYADVFNIYLATQKSLQLDQTDGGNV